ncbi:MAG: tetratricopeptide repeat protein [Chlorobiaceae bacterium]|nr:tetratricopeptide repeat protein [Chlorobiaceae bacterium]
MLNTEQVQAKFEQAFASHRQGAFARAGALYEEVLELAPGHVDALHLSGVLAARCGDHRKAAGLIGKAIALYPGNAMMHFNLGIAYNSLKEFGAAAASFEKAINIKPELADANYYRGNALLKLNKPGLALECFDKAIALKPDYHEAAYNRGIALHELKMYEEAIASYELAIALKPDFAEACYNRGMALHELNKFEEALESYDRAIALKPAHANAYSNRGNALKKLKRFDAALESYGKAIALKGDFHEAYSNRGLLLRELWRFDEALENLDKSIAIKPDFAEAYSNRGLLLKDLNQLDAALENFEKAIAIIPDLAEAHLHKSVVLLLGGNFRRGWELYEWRWKVERFNTSRSDFSQPLWLGNESIKGKTLLLHSEQGYGDSIQSCRYVPLLADLGARVIVQAELPIVSLLEKLPGVSEVIEKGRALPEFDFHCPLLSLPLAFRTDLNSIPYPGRYLKSDPDKLEHWKKRLGNKTKPRVGLAWSGNAAHTSDANRSIPLSTMRKHLPEGFSYVSLQKEVRQSDKPTLESNADILHFGDELEDFTDTAALCDLMDVVISVDTSIAHLNGALGNPTWVLLPFIPDWRWMLDRDDSPWYQSVRLFRQQGPNNWDSVFERLVSSLLSVYGQQ